MVRDREARRLRDPVCGLDSLSVAWLISGHGLVSRVRCTCYHQGLSSLTPRRNSELTSCKLVNRVPQVCRSYLILYVCDRGHAVVGNAASTVTFTAPYLFGSAFTGDGCFFGSCHGSRGCLHACLVTRRWTFTPMLLASSQSEVSFSYWGAPLISSARVSVAECDNFL